MADSPAPTPNPSLLHEFFLRAVERHPTAVAIDVPPGSDRATRQLRTYLQLREDAMRVATGLAPVVAEDAVVAILLDRGGAALYAAQIGVLAAGAAYVALETPHPDEHLRFVLADAAAVAAITDAAGARRLRALVPSLRVFLIEELLASAMPAAVPAPAWLLPSSLAYLIYTSGTTGRPKGVMIEHHSIACLVEADLAEFGLGPGDRIAQGSSPAYDSSVEETWLALAAGATVVPLDHDTVRLGPDLVSWLQRERITVLCPPPTLLRTTGCEHPARELPDLRLVYAGGEALPQDLADRWAAGRRFVNGYGPTECTVTVVRGDVRPGEPVSIGWPVPGSVAFVVDAALQPAPEGEAGELCIGGASLARGYLRRPELTAERFVEYPGFGRVYRTGDRVRRGASGALFYEGRLDAQVKLHGHRVELQEIESRLASCGGVREAACTVEAGDLLVAFVVPIDANAPPDCTAIAAALRSQVPGHMVPVRFELLAKLPVTVGGKLDRKALPSIAALPAAGVRGAAPRNELEASIAAAFASQLRMTSVGCDLDFFDLGGDSVRAAGVVSQLRTAATTSGLTVRDIYERRTAQALAALAAGQIQAPARTRRTTQLPISPRLVSLLQAGWLAAELVGGAGFGYLVVTELARAIVASSAPAVVLVLLPLFWLVGRLVFVPFAVLVAVLGKLLLIGRYTARREPVYGLWYLRHWCVLRLVRWVPWELLQGTELQLAALRALGARIGARVHLHRGVDLRNGGWDLLVIGDDAAVGQDACLGLCELADGHLVVAPVRVGQAATLEVRAGMRGHTELGEGACLMPLSSLPCNARVPAGERWDGVPAVRVGAVGAPPRPTVGGEALGPVAHTAMVLVARGTASMLWAAPLLLLFLAAWLFLGVDLIGWLANGNDPIATWWAMVCTTAVLVLAVPCSAGFVGLLMRWLPAVPAGVLRTRSRLHVIADLRTQALDAVSVWLSGTVFWPWWLRLAGARIGRRAEISTIVDVLPEQVTIGNDCFLADGIYLGGPRVERGTVTVAPVVLGDETFLGNHVVIPPGTSLPPNILLGVCTVANAAPVVAGTAWFGHPPFALPRREVVQADRRLTFEPGLLRVVNRWFWELLRATLPVVPAIAVVVWWELLAASGASGPQLWFVVVPAVTLAVMAVPPLLVLAAKWLLLGRVRPGQHALWSCWCSRWDFLYVAWGFLCRPVIERFGGTLWLAIYLRAMGMQIGRSVVLGPGFAHVVDPDMLHFEDGATVDTMFQAHSFEDRVLKIAPVHVRAGASLGHATVVLYGADIGPGSDVAPHSVVMKNEHLPGHRSYIGVPVQHGPGSLG